VEGQDKEGSDKEDKDVNVVDEHVFKDLEVDVSNLELEEGIIVVACHIGFQGEVPHGG
jgi:hypothetical protein